MDMVVVQGCRGGDRKQAEENPKGSRWRAVVKSWKSGRIGGWATGEVGGRQVLLLLPLFLPHPAFAININPASLNFAPSAAKLPLANAARSVRVPKQHGARTLYPCSLTVAHSGVRTVRSSVDEHTRSTLSASWLCSITGRVSKAHSGLADTVCGLSL